MATNSFRKETLVRNTLRRVSAASNNSTNSNSGNGISDTADLEAEFVSWSICQEIILRLLQGNKVEMHDKILVGVSVRRLIMKNNLANLLCESIQRQLLPQAFKGIVADVFTAKHPLKQLVESWILIYTVVLPDFQLALCSLTEFTKLDTKRVLMVAFRDALVLGCPNLEQLLTTCPSTPSLIWQMLLVLEFTTRDNTEIYKKLESICCQTVQGFLSISFISNDGDLPTVKTDEFSTSDIPPSPKSPVSKTYSRVTWAKKIHEVDNGTRRHSSAQCVVAP